MLQGQGKERVVEHTFDVDFNVLDVPDRRHEIVLWVVNKKNIGKLGVQTLQRPCELISTLQSIKINCGIVNTLE